MDLPDSKFRLMISYNGHIVPRPHDKSLCYVGGETRIFAADRSSSLSSLSDRLAKTLTPKPFTLKYQLPNEDLDSLISLSTDEDFENMLEEYDRFIKENRLGRIRVFLFPAKPESGSSVGSEDWFLSIMNGSDLGSVTCAGRDDDVLERKLAGKDGEEKLEGLMETTSSFGSGVSSSRGHVDDDKRSEQGIQSQVQLQWKPDGGVDLLSPVSASSENGTTNQTNQTMGAMIYPEPLVQNHTDNNRMAVQAVDPVQVQQGQDCGYMLPCQMDQQNHQYTALRPQKLPPEYQQQRQQQYLPFNTPPQQEQQQFIQPSPQHNHHPMGRIVPVRPYFPIYPPQQPPLHTQTVNDPNHRVLYLPHGQAKAYNLPIQQSNYNETTQTLPGIHSQMLPLPKQDMAKTGTNQSQIRPQYVNFNQIHHSSQLIPNAFNYVYEVSDPSHTQVYYTQPLASQYPNMALAPKMVVPKSSAKFSTDNVKQHGMSSQQWLSSWKTTKEILHKLSGLHFGILYASVFCGVCIVL